jgi:predicted MFS family arabinose efflux permease
MVGARHLCRSLFRLRYGASQATITILIPSLGAAYVAGSLAFAMPLRSARESRVIQAAIFSGVLTAVAVMAMAAPIPLMAAAGLGAVLAFSRPPGIAGVQTLPLRGESGKIDAPGTALSYSQLVVTAGMLGGTALGALFLGNGRPTGFLGLCLGLGFAAIGSVVALVVWTVRHRGRRPPARPPKAG